MAEGPLGEPPKSKEGVFKRLVSLVRGEYRKNRPSGPRIPADIDLTHAVHEIRAGRTTEVPENSGPPQEVFGLRPGGGRCHGCKHFAGDGPRDRRYRPQGTCNAVSSLITERDVTWRSPACKAYLGWGFWCEQIGRAHV